MSQAIPRIDATALAAGEPEARAQMRLAAREIGFATVYNTAISAQRVREVIETYRAFFHLPKAQKAKVDMALTGSNRGWGGPGSEQVDPEANPDYKQVFDCGLSLPEGHPLLAERFYAPNIWPDIPVDFQGIVSKYYEDALAVSLDVLYGLAGALDRSPAGFDRAFERPMALLRGNFYPQRPAWAGEKDFGIAPHTDYGCLTLLATDGAPGLEVRTRAGGWIPVAAPPGEFIINFGEMLQFWSAGEVVATPHRVKGTQAERISVPLFFNPSHDTNVAPPGSGGVILAGDHLSRRFNETYLHLQSKTG